MEIRHYRDGDEEGLVRLFNLAFSEHGAHLVRTPESWRWRYRAQPGFDPELVFVAEDGEGIVGSIILTPHEFRSDGEVLQSAVVDDYATHPRARGRGLARGLMAAAVGAARDRGLDALTSYVGAGSASMRLHFEQGFFKVCEISARAVVIRPLEVLVGCGGDILPLLLPELKKALADPGVILSAFGERQAPGAARVRARAVREWAARVRSWAELSPDRIIDFVDQRRLDCMGSRAYAEAEHRWRFQDRPHGSLGFRYAAVDDGRVRALLAAHTHRNRFTKSGRELVMAYADTFMADPGLEPDSRLAAGRALVERVCRDLDRKGIPVLLLLSRAGDELVRRSPPSGRLSLNAESSLLIFNDLKGRDLRPDPGRMWLDAESLFGEP